MENITQLPTDTQQQLRIDSNMDSAANSVISIWDVAGGAQETLVLSMPSSAAYELGMELIRRSVGLMATSEALNVLAEAGDMDVAELVNTFLMASLVRLDNDGEFAGASESPEKSPFD